MNIDTSALDEFERLHRASQTKEGRQALRDWLDYRDREERRTWLAIYAIGTAIVVLGLGSAVGLGLLLSEAF